VAHRTPSIRKQLAALVLVCVVPPSILAAIWLAIDYEQDKNQAAVEAVGRARAVMSAVDRELAGIQAALTSLGTSPYLRRGDFAAFDGQARQVAAGIAVNNIVLIDASFQQQMNTLRAFGSALPIEGNQTLRAVFKTHAPVTTNVFLGPVAKRPLVAVAVPIHDGEVVRYVLAAGVWPEQLSAILNGQHLDPSWIGAIFDASGTIVARTHQMQKFVGAKGAPALVERMQQVREGYLETKTLEGTPVISAFSRSAVSQWSVALGIPSKGFAQALWGTLSWLLVAVVVLATLSLALAWRVGSAITESIAKLAQFAGTVSRGERVDALPDLGLKEANDVGEALRSTLQGRLAAEHKAHHDMLTGLANRALFYAMTDSQIGLCRREGKNLAVLFIDLDGFKRVNDEHGHEMGDRLLIEVASRLKSVVRASDLVARLGGDEFCVLLFPADVTAAQAKGRAVVDAVSEPYFISQRKLQISASVGVAVFPECGESGEQLLKRADEAMYRVKTAGKRGVAVAAC
jgi:diguanylate cyclase (GGDEF)-like protein